MDETTKTKDEKEGWDLIINDLKKKELIPIKIISFLIFASNGILLPFVLSNHLKSLGLDEDETVIVHRAFAVFSILAPFVSGIIADKIGNFKIMMVTSFVLVDITVLLFLAIPMGRLIEPYPTNSSFAIGCSPAAGYKGIFTLTDLDSIECDFNPSTELSLTVQDCGYVCMDTQVEDSYYKEAIILSLPADHEHQSPIKFRNGLFIREKWSIDIICPDRGNCKLTRVISTDEDKKEPILLRQIELQNVENHLFFVDKITLSNRQTRKVIQCPNDYDLPIRLSSPLNYKDAIVYKMCRPQCLAHAQRSEICSNKENTTEFNPQLTFWSYLILKICFAMFWASSMVLFDGACLAVVIQVKGDLGLQRIFGLIGLMILGPITGTLIHQFSNIELDYRSTFYIYALLTTLAIIVIPFIELNFKRPNTDLLKDLKSLLKNIELHAFLIIVFMSGLLFCHVENCLYWLIREMGGTQSLMGLNLFIYCLFGISLLIVSNKIFKKMGYSNVLLIGLVVYFIRLFGYSYIRNPYLSLIYESMESVTTALVVTSMMIYSIQLSTPTTLTTIQGLIGAAYFGMGRGMDTFVGSFLVEWLGTGFEDKTYGTRASFRVLGVTALGMASLYLLFILFYIRPQNRKAIKKHNSIPLLLQNSTINSPHQSNNDTTLL